MKWAVVRLWLLRGAIVVPSLAASGGLLLFLTLYPKSLSPDHPLETPAVLIYRVVFLLVAPVRLLASGVFPALDHRWHMNSHIASCIGTPVLFAILIGGIVWFLRLRRGKKRQDSNAEASPTRRAFLTKGVVGLAGCGAAGVALDSVVFAPQRVRVVEYAIPIQDLPPALDGLRVIQLADTHYGTYTDMAFLKHVVEKANALEPDIYVLTGDYVQQARDRVEAGVHVFARLESRFGAVGVLGNHDHWESAPRSRAAFADIGIPLVDNGRRFLTRDGLNEDAREDAICVGGVGDFWEDDVLFNEALANVPDSIPRIVLCHNPDVAEHMDDAPRVDLLCCGHTHGGQVHLPMRGAPIVPSRFGQKYLGGVVQGPKCRVMVSRGIGMAYLPIRFNVPPEIVLATLKRA
jgi:hypothetical protein